jgi:hypothetical protein
MSYDSVVLSGSFNTLNVDTGYDSVVLSGSFETLASGAGYDSVVLSGSFQTLSDQPYVIGPATMVSGATVVVTVGLFTGAIAVASIGTINVSASIQQTGDQVTLTVPDMFLVGLARGAQTIYVANAGETETATTQVELLPPAHYYHRILDGYATIVETVWTRTLAPEVQSMADDNTVQLVDGDEFWYYDPQDYLTVDAAAVASMAQENAPYTVGRMWRDPDSTELDAGPNGIYSVLGDYTIYEAGPWGLMSVQEVGADTLTADGAVAISGILEVQEVGADVFSAAVIGQLSMQLMAQESGADIFSAIGFLSTAGDVTGLLNVQELGADVLVSQGTVRVTGYMPAVESTVDVFSALGFVPPPDINGVLNVKESQQDVVSIVARSLFPGKWAKKGPVRRGWVKKDPL